MHKSKTVQSSTESIKILVLLQDEEIKWMSLKKIQRGYLKSISLIKNTHLVYVKSGPQFFSFLEEIDTHQPDVVVFLDISLQNPELIKLILGRMAKKLRFIFVLYGGFIQSTYPAWRSQEKDLKGLDIGFVSASNAYKDIQQKYFLNKSH